MTCNELVLVLTDKVKDKSLGLLVQTKEVYLE